MKVTFIFRMAITFTCGWPWYSIITQRACARGKVIGSVIQLLSLSTQKLPDLDLGILTSGRC